MAVTGVYTRTRAPTSRTRVHPGFRVLILTEQATWLKVRAGMLAGASCVRLCYVCLGLYPLDDRLRRIRDVGMTAI